jgi:hypothetical protein
MSKLRESARGESCLVRIPGVCTYDPATVILSHYRGQSGGKGMGIKSNDLCSAYACTACDAVYDGQRKRPLGMTKEEVDLAWHQGHIRTLVRMREKGVI